MNLEDKIYKKRKVPKAFSRQLLRQRHLSAKQIEVLTGKRSSEVLNLSAPKDSERARKEPVLTRVYPYPIEPDVESGPVMIKVDEKCKKFISECNTDQK